MVQLKRHFGILIEPVVKENADAAGGVVMSAGAAQEHANKDSKLEEDEPQEGRKDETSDEVCRARTQVSLPSETDPISAGVCT